MQALTRWLVPLALVFSLAALGADVFYCPMRCEGKKTYPAAGACPVCGMDLEKQTGAAAEALNSRDFRVDVATEKVPKAAEPVTLTFSLRRTKDSSPLKDLETVHEKQFHLVIVSQDLSFFAHEHPEPVAGAPGDLRTTFTFPAGGNYVLFADFTPKGAKGQVVPLAFQVDGAKRPEVPLKPTVGKPRKVDGYEITLAMTPAPKVGAGVTLKYRIRKGGKDVKDLEPYLGAAGHSIVISEDTTRFLHSHPVELGGGGHGGHGGHGEHAGHAAAAKAYGPEVSFQTMFPKPGVYKLWAQFKRGGKIVTVEDVVNVKQ